MEVRRSARIAAAKQAKIQETQEPWEESIKKNYVLLRRRNGVIVNVDKDEISNPKPIVYQKHEQTSLFINFIVHGVMKYEINDPKAREMKEKTLHFFQLTFAFVLIKSIFWYFGVL